MSLLHLIIVALVQGITEFLPISSSGHLVLVPHLFGWQDQGLLIDVAVHVGTLMAVLIYFARDTKGLFLGFLASLGVAPARRAVAGTRYVSLFWILVVATLPVMAVGLVLAVTGLADAMRLVPIIAATSIIFGVLLYVVDIKRPQDKTFEGITMKVGFLIGLAQVLALIPGTSRSGITLTAARQMGFKRTDAARFSMLLAIPTIIAAGLLAMLKLLQDGADGAFLDAAIAGGLAFFAALVAIHFLMKWLARASMTIFVIYRVALGVGLFGWYFTVI